MTASQLRTTARWSLPVLTAGWALFLFWVSTSTRAGEAASRAAGWFDWLVPPAAHLGGYAVLAVLMGITLWGVPRLATRLWAVLAAAFVVATVYGAAIELYQTTVPRRVGSWGDVGLNAAGASAALVALTAVHGRGPRPGTLIHFR